MERTELQSESGPGGNSSPTGWSKSARCAASALLLFHLAALVVAPCSVEPSSYLSVQTWRFFQPYLDAAYLNHGYHFFAPEPGPSHLVRYELELADGTIKTGR